jgi:hypothetical protein
MPKKELEVLRRESGSLGCPCVWLKDLASLASMISSVIQACSYIVYRYGPDVSITSI